LFDVSGGREVRRFEGALVPLAFTADSRVLASAQSSGIMMWDVVTGKLLRNLQLEKQVSASFMKRVPAAFSPDGKTFVLQLASGEGSQPPVIVITPYLCAVDMGTGKTRWYEKQASPDSLAFSPDGKLIAEGMGGTIRLRDAKTGNKLKDLILASATEPKYAAAASRLVFTADSKTLIAGDGGPRVYFWDTVTGKQRHATVGHTGSVLAVSVAPDGKSFATGSADTTALIWSMPEF
jgi:WD40 repeat protein